MKFERTALSTTGGAIVLAVIVVIGLAVYLAARPQGTTSSAPISASPSPSGRPSLPTLSPGGNLPIANPGAVAPGDQLQACIRAQGAPELCPTVIVSGPVIAVCSQYEEGCPANGPTPSSPAVTPGVITTPGVKVTPGAIAPDNKLQACLSQQAAIEDCMQSEIIPGPVVLSCTQYDERCPG